MHGQPWVRGKNPALEEFKSGPRRPFYAFPCQLMDFWIIFEIWISVTRGYSQPKEHYTGCFSRCKIVFPAIWLNFISYPQNIVIKYLRNICRTLIENTRLQWISTMYGNHTSSESLKFQDYDINAFEKMLHINISQESVFMYTMFY